MADLKPEFHSNGIAFGMRARRVNSRRHGKTAKPVWNYAAMGRWSTKGYKNLHEYSTGDQEFDQQFRVWTNNNEEAKVLLSSAVQWQMDQLRHNAQLQKGSPQIIK